MKYIDAHVHIDFYLNINRTIMDMILNNVASVFVTHLPELYEKYYEQIKLIKAIYLALGYHPNVITEYPFNYNLFEKLSKTTRFIGEVGLDYTITKSERVRNQQREVFETICSISQNHILSIHSRKAEKDVLKILSRYNIKSAIFHWYTGELELINEIVERGYYFSINPAMLRSKKGRMILKSIPLNRILVETDGPFIKFNGEIVSSKHIENIYKIIAEFYSLDCEQFKRIVNTNFRNLFNYTNTYYDEYCKEYRNFAVL